MFPSRPVSRLPGSECYGRPRSYEGFGLLRLRSEQPGGRTRPTTAVTDPVCGMPVDRATSKHRAEHQGVTYHFCCGGCQSKFEADPVKYLAPDLQPLPIPRTR